MKNKKALLEAALFISSEPLSLKDLCKIAKCSENEALEILKEIDLELKESKRGIELFSIEGNYNLRVKENYLGKVSHLTPYSDLSRAMLKVLSLTVYKQPITQSDIVKTIGNRAYVYIKNLESRGLIKTEKFGRTKKLDITPEFMKYFGVSSREELLNTYKNKTGKEFQADSDFGDFFKQFDSGGGDENAEKEPVS